MNNKKGISAIVATVLIILITVAAVTIIWAAIIPMINNQLDSSTLCVDAVADIRLSDDGHTCNYENGNISVQIEHGPKDIELADIQIIVYKDGNSEVFGLTATEGFNISTLPGANEARVFVINVSNTSITTVDKVEIAPVVKSGVSQTVCNPSDEVVLTKCAI